MKGVFGVLRGGAGCGGRGRRAARSTHTHTHPPPPPASLGLPGRVSVVAGLALPTTPGALAFWGALCGVPARVIVPDHADQARLSAQSGNVGRHVGGPAGHMADGFLMHHRNGRLGRDARHRSFEIDVENQVAEDEDLHVPEADRAWRIGGKSLI